MALKTLVKVGNITNLSDARYCSGMGVEMLGFTVIEGQPDYIDPSLFQEIRGWISGPSVVACLYGMRENGAMESIITSYAPDLFELNVDQLTLLTPASIPLIVTIHSAEDLYKLKPYHNRIRYVQVAESNKDIISQSSYPVICEIQSGEDVPEFVDQHNDKGIALSGSPEVRPGFKDYGDLADVLEQLEVD